jgi:hypothetical protein
MKKKFNHEALKLGKKKKFVYTAMSKHLAYFKDHISQFVMRKGYVPLNPFAIPYFMLDTLPRDVCREVNNNLVMGADEIWIFGKVSDGILAEMMIAKKAGKRIRYFTIIKSKQIKEISNNEAEFEDDAKHFHVMI